MADTQKFTFRPEDVQKGDLYVFNNEEESVGLEWGAYA
jgi:hypothetical protein